MKNQQLWSAIEAFDIDHAEATLTFTKRFARDHKMSEDEAHALIREYKRFMYLVACYDEQLTPSHMVDLVWHMHMTYTQSYWEDFCGCVLNKSIHHNPTKGRRKDSKQYTNQYQRTIRLYQENFEMDPPSAFWDPVHVRVKRRAVTVSPDDHWLIAKPDIVKKVSAARVKKANQQSKTTTNASISSGKGLAIGCFTVITAMIALAINSWHFFAFVCGVGLIMLIANWETATSKGSSDKSGDSSGCGGCGYSSDDNSGDGDGDGGCGGGGCGGGGCGGCGGCG